MAFFASFFAKQLFDQKASCILSLTSSQFGAKQHNIMARCAPKGLLRPSNSVTNNGNNNDTHADRGDSAVRSVFAVKPTFFR